MKAKFSYDVCRCCSSSSWKYFAIVVLFRAPFGRPRPRFPVDPCWFDITESGDGNELFNFSNSLRFLILIKNFFCDCVKPVRRNFLLLCIKLSIDWYATRLDDELLRFGATICLGGGTRQFTPLLRSDNNVTNSTSLFGNKSYVRGLTQFSFSKIKATLKDLFTLYFQK